MHLTRYGHASKCMGYGGYGGKRYEKWVVGPFLSIGFFFHLFIPHVVYTFSCFNNLVSFLNNLELPNSHTLTPNLI